MSNLNTKKCVDAAKGKILGGKGSGNFGHSGRPGERGGSGEGGGSGKTSGGKSSFDTVMEAPDGLDTLIANKKIAGQESFDWKETREMQKWQDRQEKKGRTVYRYDTQDDQFTLFASKKELSPKEIEDSGLEHFDAYDFDTDTDEEYGD